MSRRPPAGQSRCPPIATTDGSSTWPSSCATMMPASAPPHVEFLDYKTPPGGRPMPADTKGNDLWHWQTSLVTKDIRAVADRLRKAGAQFITPEVIAIPQEAQTQLGFKRAIVVRDPTGHAIRL